MKKVILLNSPPHSGKDTIAHIFMDNLDAVKLQFKDTLYLETAKEFGVSIDFLMAVSTSRYIKEVPQWLFSTHPACQDRRRPFSPREALIYTSEEVIKKKLGQDYFGQCMLKNILANPFDLFIVPDGGFDAEVDVLANHKDIDLTVARLHRKGFTFEGDSRKYITKEVDNVQYLDIILEDGNPDRGYREIYDELTHWLR
jgi:hypothetical protein